MKSADNFFDKHRIPGGMAFDNDREYLCGAERITPETDRPHRVPLSTRTLEILTEAQTIRDHSGLMFPSLRGNISNFRRHALAVLLENFLLQDWICKKPITFRKNIKNDLLAGIEPMTN